MVEGRDNSRRELAEPRTNATQLGPRSSPRELRQAGRIRTPPAGRRELPRVGTLRFLILWARWGAGSGKAGTSNPSSPDTRSWSGGGGAGLALEAHQEGQGREGGGKGLRGWVRSVDAARVNASWDPPASSTWNLGAASRFREMPVPAQQRGRPCLAQTDFQNLSLPVWG